MKLQIDPDRNPMDEYKAIFGEYPPTFDLPGTPEEIGEAILKAIEEKKPLWTYFFSANPYDSQQVI
jgi:hypothetical protein